MNAPAPQPPCGECKIYDACQKAYLAGTPPCAFPRSPPTPSPEPEVYGCNLSVISPKKDCFGKYVWKDSISSDDECFICPVYGYCIDVSARAAQAREELFEAIKAEYDPVTESVDWDSIEAAYIRCTEAHK